MSQQQPSFQLQESVCVVCSLPISAHSQLNQYQCITEALRVIQDALTGIAITYLPGNTTTYSVANRFREIDFAMNALKLLCLNELDGT